MNTTFLLTDLLSFSDETLCNGYTVDNWWPNDPKGKLRLMCGDDDIVILPLDQKVEMTPEGNVGPVEHDGDLYFFEFGVLHTLTPNMIPKE